MNTIKECFDTILRGDKNNSRLAARRVRKLLYSSRGDRDKYDVLKGIINGSASEYVKISEDWRQENFVMAVSVIYYLHDRENQPDFLFPWLFPLLQHSNSYIRHAAVKMITHEIGPLTYHIRFPGEKLSFNELQPAQADTILNSLSHSLNGLLTILWEPRFKKYKYIESLPASPYKSVQMILAELEESYEPPEQELENYHRSPMEIESKEQILQRRKELKNELVDMLKETKSDFTLDYILDAIYNEEDNDDMMKVVAMFDRGGGISELENILELVNDAWNYFPHKTLNGLSPAEKVLEYKNKK